MNAPLPRFAMEALHGLVPDFAVLAFPRAQAKDCLAGRDEDDCLWLVAPDPPPRALLEWAEQHMAEPYRLALAELADIRAWLARQEGELKALDAFGTLAGAGAADSGGAQELSLAAIGEDDSPVIRLVHSTLYDALQAGVSDIHLENDPQGLVIKYRLDGVLAVVSRVAGADMAEQAISRIKVMAELDIAERRIPQDGRFKVRLQGREVDLRVSIMPGVHGEDAVLRILDRRQLADEIQGLRLEHLGFDAGILASLRKLTHEPYGMVLVTGPTGSGKTTTLYAAISEINHGRDKIITIEDPVEYQLPGVLQIPVNEKKGLTFARGLRSILRHDPDKIMVGEIRDTETAQIAVQSALTGHLVLTTVHANNVFDVLGRFLQLGVDPYNLVYALNGILAQRLVRMNCSYCSVDEVPAPELLAASGITDSTGFRFRAGRGCAHCRGTGYKGRQAVAEMLVMNDHLREMIVAREPMSRIKEEARRGGTHSLRAAAVEFVRAGRTTLEEINRVTFVA